jgi:hypothetical protein
MLRSDISNVVRQSAVLLWKNIVGNTSGVLKEVMGKLMSFTITFLASNNTDMRNIAARCLGDVVGKLGERVLQEIVPILSKSMATGDRSVREGACLGLCEVIDSGTKKQLENFTTELLSVVQIALSDESPEVRGAAAKAFDTLNRTLGQGAVDEIGNHFAPFFLSAYYLLYNFWIYSTFAAC